MARGRWRNANGPVIRTHPPSAPQDADPANGEKVPRCAICGMPEVKGSRIIPGMWGYLRFNMPLNVCERCVIRFAPVDHRSSDPLTVWEEVA